MNKLNIQDTFNQELPADPGPHIRTDRLDGDDADAVDYRQLLALPVLGEISAAPVSVCHQVSMMGQRPPPIVR